MEILLNIAGWTAFACVVIVCLWAAWLVWYKQPIPGTIALVFVVCGTILSAYSIYVRVYPDHPTYQLCKD